MTFLHINATTENSPRSACLCCSAPVTIKSNYFHFMHQGPGIATVET